MRLVLLGLAALCLLQPHVAHAEGEEPEEFFARYVRLSHAFDLAVLDLYSDRARIVSLRTYPWGEVKRTEIPISQWRAMIRKTMAISKARGDKSLFSSIEYIPEGANVRIKATRFSTLKEYEAPYAMLLVREGEKWRIAEEIIHTKP